MSSTRSIIAPPPFASTALTVIPPTPVAGVSYRDEAAGPASSPDGWPYAERVNSAEFNQILYQATSLLSIIDKKGVLGWSSEVDYTEASVAFGSDGVIYQWLQASGPAGAGAKDPTSNPTYWAPLKAGQLIAVRTFTASTTYTPTPGTRLIIVEGVGGGASGGGSQATSSGQAASGGGGGNGAYAKGQFTTGFSGAAITIGNGGAASAIGGNGVSGAATSLGAIFSCPGGVPGGQGIAVAPPQVGGVGGGPGSSPTGGNIVSVPGGVGFPGVSFVGGYGGPGSDSMFGKGGWAPVAAGGRDGVGYGSGSSGAFSPPSTGTARASTAGQPGILIIHEYS